MNDFLTLKDLIATDPEFQENPDTEEQILVNVRVERYLSTREVASRLNCSTTTVRTMIHKGQVEFFRRPKGHYFITETALDEYLEQNTCHAQDNQQDLSEYRESLTGTSETAAKSIQRQRKIAKALNNG